MWLAAIGLSLGACSGSGSEGADSKTAAASEGSGDACSWRRPDMSLNPGYALVWGTVDAFAGMDKVLWIKSESDAFQELLESVTDYAGKLAETLEELDERDDTIDLKAPAMPKVIEDARISLGEDMKETVGGLVSGADGAELERTLLMALDQGLSESRAVVRELARRESSKERHGILAEADVKLGEHVRAVRRQLVARHYRTRTPEGE
ncbi:MAG: hypothetical protein R3F39_14775 [Myxococcota bacterium]